VSLNGLWEEKRLFLILIASLQADILQLRLREGERLFQYNLGIRTPLRISPRLPYAEVEYTAQV